LNQSFNYKNGYKKLIENKYKSNIKKFKMINKFDKKL